MTQGGSPGQAGFTFEILEREISFDLDEELYHLDAIYGAAYLFMDRCYVFLSRPGDRLVRVRLRLAEAAPEDALERLGGEFANELLSQALRLRVSRSTAAIRDRYLARAFFSLRAESAISKLLAELDAEELDEDPLEIAVPWETKNGAGSPDGAPPND
jgi:His-Xaa-Ser system protein HxsD